MKNFLKISLITFATISILGFSAYFLGRKEAKKRIIDLIPNETPKDKENLSTSVSIVHKATNKELVDLFNYFESIHLKVAKKDMSKDLVAIIDDLGKKYEFDLLSYAK